MVANGDRAAYAAPRNGMQALEVNLGVSEALVRQEGAEQSAPGHHNPDVAGALRDALYILILHVLFGSIDDIGLVQLKVVQVVGWSPVDGGEGRPDQGAQKELADALYVSHVISWGRLTCSRRRLLIEAAVCFRSAKYVGLTLAKPRLDDNQSDWLAAVL